MANTANHRHNLIENTALPYITNKSLIFSEPRIVSGSNIMTSQKGFLERRPGFPQYTIDAFGSHALMVRFFHWQKWNGDLFVMSAIVDPIGPSSLVYKIKVGTDTQWQLIHTESSSAEPFDFVVARNFVMFSNGVDMKKYDGTTVTNWGHATQASAASAPTTSNAGAGNVPAIIGHKYVFAYGTSGTGYIGDISPESTVIATAGRTWDVTGARNAVDTDCNEVHIYRTEDGGSISRELSNSPIANIVSAGTWTITDNDADDSLKSTQAPLKGLNAKPIASKGPVLYAGRIWSFVDDTLCFTGQEEITNGVAEFSMPLINRRRMGRAITGLVVSSAGLLIYTANEIFRISGDLLSNFSFASLAKHYGSRNRAAIASDGTTVFWLDVGNAIWATDGYQISTAPVSDPIAPDIASITQASAGLDVHNVSDRKWLVLADGGAGKLRVFDFVTRQWMPPWAIAGLTAVKTVEVGVGTWYLLIGINNGVNAKSLRMDPTTFQDDSVSYTAFMVTNLLPTIAQGNPKAHGQVQYISTERNAVALTDVKYLIDEDPSTGTYTSVYTTTIATNPVTPQGRTNGTNLVEEWWRTNLQTQARRVSVRLDWAAANTSFKLYSLDPSFTISQTGGRL